MISAIAAVQRVSAPLMYSMRPREKYVWTILSDLSTAGRQSFHTSYQGFPRTKFGSGATFLASADRDQPIKLFLLRHDQVRDRLHQLEAAVVT